jgi:hypothetical protein
VVPAAVVVVVVVPAAVVVVVVVPVVVVVVVVGAQFLPEFPVVQLPILVRNVNFE